MLRSKLPLLTKLIKHLFLDYRQNEACSGVAAVSAPSRVIRSNSWLSRIHIAAICITSDNTKSTLFILDIPVIHNTNCRQQHNLPKIPISSEEFTNSSGCKFF